MTHHTELLNIAYKAIFPLANIPDTDDEVRRILNKEVVDSNPHKHWDAGRNLGDSLRCWQWAHNISFIPISVGAHAYDMRDLGRTERVNMLNREQVRDVHAALENMPVYGAHVWRLSDNTAVQKKDFVHCSYKLDDILKLPHLAEVATDQMVLSIVREYLGCVPVIYQMNLMWTLPGKSEIGQEWHRDYDGFRFVTMMVYLTDVGEKNGPHAYKLGSHKAEDGEIDVFTGSAGHAIIEDGYGLHKGFPVEEGERLVFWVRYGLYDNGYSKDCGAPVISARFPDRYMAEPLVIPVE